MNEQDERDRMLDRMDPKWAHPSVADTWEGGGWAERADTLDPSLSLDEADTLRIRQEDMAAEMVLGAIPPELAATGTTSVVQIPVTGVEQGAPSLEVTVRTPTKQAAGPMPAIFFIGGGGLSTSDPRMFTIQIMDLASANGAVVVAPRYRVAPRWQYPAAVNDLQAAFEWMVENAKELRVDTDKIVIFGQSSGGHLAAALTHRMKRVGYPEGVRPRAQILREPVIDDRESRPAARLVPPVWNPVEQRKMWRAWLGEGFASVAVSPEAVPGHALAEEFSGLPPAFIHSNEHDQGRDDVVWYAEQLWAAGVFCDLHVWGGANHMTIIASAGSDLANRMDALYFAQIADALSFDLRRNGDGV